MVNNLFTLDVWDLHIRFIYDREAFAALYKYVYLKYYYPGIYGIGYNQVPFQRVDSEIRRLRGLKVTKSARVYMTICHHNM